MPGTHPNSRCRKRGLVSILARRPTIQGQRGFVSVEDLARIRESKIRRHILRKSLLCILQLRSKFAFHVSSLKLPLCAGCTGAKMKDLPYWICQIALGYCGVFQLRTTGYCKHWPPLLHHRMVISPLASACLRGHFDFVYFLMAKGACIYAINQQWSNRRKKSEENEATKLKIEEGSNEGSPSHATTCWYKRRKKDNCVRLSWNQLRFSVRELRSWRHVRFYFSNIDDLTCRSSVLKGTFMSSIGNSSKGLMSLK